MDSKAILDYALFQLTPTRTRCELIVFSGGVREKIASGLFEPFVSHLKFLKDEISKGGYSIKLLPPSNGAFWFSKATFHRFVRFVSTPAVLERFVSIEKEILQIESSFQANALSIANLDEGMVPQSNGNASRLSDSAKLNGVIEDVDNKEVENSKVSLHRLLEARIALLRKEQAMAYTRGLVAGFEIDSIDGLICFANAFGASRLREACINFKELWKKKHADDLWLREVAAMQSCLPSDLSFSGTSGIVLANDMIGHEQIHENNSSKDSISSGEQKSDTSNKKEDVNLATPDQKPSHAANIHMPMPWPYNVPPPYMFNLQNPVQQMHSYQGYPMNNMQPVPPHFLRNMQWSPDLGANQKPSATKKKKSHYRKGSEEYEDQQTESSDADSGSASNSDEQQDSNHSSKDDSKRKKNRRKSSGTVVIRNINYITPKGRNGNEGSDESLDDNDAIDEEAIKQKVGAALGSLQKVHKVGANGKKASSRRNATKSSDATDQDLIENSGDASDEGNKNENWDVFKNLLKIDEDTGIDGSERVQQTDGSDRMMRIDVQDEQFMVRNSEEGTPYASSSPHLDFKEVLKNPKVPSDSFIVTNGDGGNEGRSKLDEYVDSRGPVTKSRDGTGEEILMSHRPKESGNEFVDPLLTFTADSSVTKIKTADDWFIVDNLEKNRSTNPTITPAVFDGDNILSSVNDGSHAERRSQGNLVDDSFMIQGPLVDNNTADSQWKTDISVVADLNSASKVEGDMAASNQKHASSKNQEPSDLYVVLQRDSGLDSFEASRTMDYEIDFSFTENCRRSSVDDSQDNANKEIPVSPEKINMIKSKVSGTRSSEKEKTKGLRGSAQKGKPDITPRNKRPSLTSRTVVQKSKREQEDEIRKKMEELALERQKRIAERTVASGLARVAPKKDQVEGRTARVSTDKNRTQSIKETNRVNSVKVREI